VLGWLGARDGFGITALGQRVFLADRKAFAQWLRELAATVTPQVVLAVAHGEPITADCAERLREAANRLD
jgi:hypothetical protein